ncbi:MAG: cell envelope integrity protein TolA [Gammaproteobacteria bacterium]|nr:cell envelope integrity protein TolA [Gammaproteobacteria bacterium]MCP5138796.1 cell envelope integrity protein TolA [Chromatiales bacterium]
MRNAGFPGSAGDRWSLAWSLGIHGVLLLIILLGGIVIPHKPTPSNLGIKATLIDPDAVRKMRRRPPPPAPEARPAEPPQPDPAVQKAEADRLQAERERKLSEQKLVEQKLAEQKATEARRAEQKAAEKQLAAKKLAEQKAAEKKAAEQKAAEKKAADKAAAEKAEAQRRAAEDKRRRAAQAELDRQLAEEDALLAAADSGALAEYVALIAQKVERNWVRPPSAKAGLECELSVTQIPGGQVTGVRIGNCPADDAVRRSIEAAVLRASPLPMPANQALFDRNLRFVFKPQE